MSRNKKLAAVTGVLVTLGVVVLFIIIGIVRKPAVEPEEIKTDKPSMIADFTPDKPADRASTDAQPPAPSAEALSKKDEKPAFVKRPGAMQLPDGQVLTFPAPKEGETRKVFAYGHLYECDHEGNFRDITPRQLFHTAFEANFLGLAIEDRPFIPAFLVGLDEADVRQMLEKPYEPIGDETEEELEQLKAYDDMRAAALEYMDQGGKFDDFVDYFASNIKKERQTQAMLLREVMMLVKEGRLQEAKVTAEAANELKLKKGLKPFKIPPHVQAAFDELP